MALFHSFPISQGKKIKILIAGKKELPSESLDVQTQRKEISKFTGISESKVYILNQIHGDGVVDLSRMESFSFPEGDAFFGNESGKILCIKTADCMPLFFWSLQDSEFAAIHSGWKGTLAGIAEKTLKLAFTDSVLKSGSLLGYLGPCASGCKYEVGEDVASQFRKEFPDCLKQNEVGKTLLDLESFLKYRLEKNGIQVLFRSAGICTLEESSDFFSHRKKEVGRNLNLIWKED
ncbi:polyphenol oxidase family protein [Leptospira alstonii]|uniref:YfiH family protein n=2 Tax=Leptospira alstonii TaxID=28452 RepID=M6CWK8_9LEPT|nr:polyphenol oxidase family protein [Leptospira alstonii]EMJ96074.1 YfiH family protein [Leptospira alstonii serovar Sichuan str. 79601]EQA79709.1 YfiH family protein [Leptospira alstonii serovar Pingchang str. 80-412]